MTARILHNFAQIYLYLENKVGDLSFLFHILLVTKVLHLLSKFNQILYCAIFLNTEILL